MNKFLLIIIGILFTSIGLFFFLLYLNLFTLGYSFIDFVKFIIIRIEFWVLIIGILLIREGLGRNKHYGLFLRYFNKHERR